MEKLTIWMLAWENGSVPGGEAEAWQPVARTLGGQVKLQVLLPHNNPLVTLENVAITDLDTVELPVRPETGMPPESLPFAPIPFPAPTIPLYGTPVYTGKETGKPGQRLPGEAVRTGHHPEGHAKPPPPTPPANLHGQVIAYARKVCRFAQGKSFDGIYAFHWQTYLAALELKLVTGKKMGLQVHALSQSRRLPDRLAWMLEIEKQTFDKADAILVDHDQLAEELEREYNFVTAKLHVMDPNRQAPEELLQLFGRQPSGLADRKDPPDQGYSRETWTWAFTGMMA